MSNPTDPTAPEAANNSSNPQAPAKTPPPASATLSAEVEAEVEQAMAALGAEQDHANASAKPAPAGEKPRVRGPRRVVGGREIRPGRVASVGPDDIFIEFGPKELGVASRASFPEDKLPQQGDIIDVVVERFNANEQLYICSMPGAVTKAEWEMLEPGQVVEALVKGTNKGGLDCEVAGHRAFLPASQVELNRVEDFSPYVGQKLKCQVAKLERAGHGNIVLSRRELLNAERKEKTEVLRNTLSEGQTIDGTVSRIMDYGAFVDIGGVDGLVHVSDISHDRIRDPKSVVSEGQAVRVKILKLDWAKNRISLGIKQCMDDPYKAATGTIAAGETVTGKVTKIMEFGAFVEIAPGVEGLVHISELAWKRIAKVDSVLKPDEVITVKVLEVDPDKRRISLSLKQTTEPPKNATRGRRGEDEGPSIEEIQKITPKDRRLREEFQKKHQGLKSGLGGGGNVDLGEGLGSLTLG
ncbi:MAG: S1 RNA-binding domain-containing protein [Phycisphaeraceae bacterium]|nr:S1 RNA-binding domain-containing protein [Phycisphaeraceae bacterium]MCB9848700.1 S1 RNA-binding domain-containing protein [Phycisphaeraceae bacterium]